MVAPLLMAQTAQPDPAQQILAAHNAARAELGLTPLVWNSALAAEAQQWADHLAQTRDLAHADGAHSGQGENLWAGTRSAYTPAEMVGDWIREKRLYRPGRFPDISANGNWAAVAHYSQIVWRQTHDVGCAIGRNADQDILVCRYAEAGNVDGESPY